MFPTLLKYISWALKPMHNATQKWPLFIISIHKSLYKVLEEPQNIKVYINLWLCAGFCRRTGLIVGECSKFLFLHDESRHRRDCQTRSVKKLLYHTHGKASNVKQCMCFEISKYLPSHNTVAGSSHYISVSFLFLSFSCFWPIYSFQVATDHAERGKDGHVCKKF